MKATFFTALAYLAASANAFPKIARDPRAVEHLARAGQMLDARASTILRSLQSREDALTTSLAETNCGPIPCTTFDYEDQLISITGEYAYQSPSVSDIRGPCPGLNAAANHGYLPRSGIATIEQTVSGLGALYNLDAPITAFLAAYAVAVDGNVVEGVWSIGGPLPTDLLTGTLLGTGQGLSYSHNNYEGDGSIARQDAYTGQGDAHSLNVTKFTGVYAVGGTEDRYTLDKFRQRLNDVQNEAIANNPYYFTGLFSTIAVVPAAYNFVINLMSNHTAEEPSGYLDGYNFKSFFGITGDYPDFTWNKGQEKVPENWFRRPSTNPYTAQVLAADVGIGYAAYPETLKIGGNTGTPNSFVGVDLANFTEGVYDIPTLFEGDNFACFFFQLAQNGIPNFLDLPINELAPITDLINKYSGPILGGLSCPQLGNFSFGVFDHYPGRTYSPTGPDTNYKR